MAEFRERGFGATIGYAQMLIRGVVVINGGAAVATLAFLGHVVANLDKGLNLVALNLVPPLMTFMLGTLFGVLSAGAAYFTQSRTLDEKYESARKYLSAFIIFSCLGMGAFVFGALRAGDALTRALGG